MKQSFVGYYLHNLRLAVTIINILFVRFTIKWKLIEKQIAFMFTFYSGSFRGASLTLHLLFDKININCYFFLFSPCDFSWNTGIETSCFRFVSLQREPCESSLSRWHSCVKVERKKIGERRGRLKSFSQLISMAGSDFMGM